MSREWRENSVRAARVSLGLVALLAACSGGDGYDSPADGPAAPGGAGTVRDSSAGAFSQPAGNLSDPEGALFRIGDAFFTESWFPAHGGPEDRDGLGPTFLATSCAACHPADGRDTPPAAGNVGGTPVLRFVGDESAGIDHEAYGVQLQTRGSKGVPGEAALSISWVEMPGMYADGSAFSLRQPEISLSNAAFGDVNVANGFRIAPGLIGLGLLEAIPDEDIAANSDPDDANGDGISGVVARTPDGALGRFGLKSTVATVAHQAATAFLVELGITSPVYPEENCPDVQIACAESPSGGSPEISADRLAAVVLYAQTLAVPARTGLGDESVVEGEKVFESLGCASCHVRRWETGTHDIEALSGQIIYPYSDLLLHDMGEGLSDGRSDGTAGPTEWRTTPLWGLGLVRTVNATAGFLHDGRARTIEEAVLWHGGEASGARDAFVALEADDRRLLLLFLKSL